VSVGAGASESRRATTEFGVHRHVSSRSGRILCVNVGVFGGLGVWSIAMCRLGLVGWCVYVSMW